MLLQLAIIDQVRQHPLHHRIALPQGQRRPALQHCCYLHRCDDIAATERAAQGLGQCADVNHMPLLAIAGQRQIGPPGKVVFVVVVFLDHAEVVQPRQLQ
ncbi:hypothetical protein D3C80_1351520 [compost metagenome]